MTETIPIATSELELIIGDLTLTEADAFVFYAQSDLDLGSGFGTAISVRGGPTIKKELDELGPLETGEAIATTAGNLNAKYIIHAVGPRFQEKDTELKLRTTVKAALECAESKGATSIAFPPMGAGFYGIPLPICAHIMTQTIRDYLEQGSTLQKVVIVALDSREYKPFQESIETLMNKEAVS